MTVLHAKKEVQCNIKFPPQPPISGAVRCFGPDRRTGLDRRTGQELGLGSHS